VQVITFRLNTINRIIEFANFTFEIAYAGRWLSLLLILPFFLTACGFEGASSYGSGEENRFVEIDPQFASLNNRLEGLCGEGISPLFAKGGKQYQYTKGCLFVYNPEETAIKRYSLYPLGKQWGVEEPPEPQPDPENLGGSVYINGHYVWEEVIDLYIRIGAANIGRPLTAVRYNAEKNRYEQYFENMGFYRRKEDPIGTVKVLPYGIWTCGKACLGDQSSSRTVAIPATPPYTPAPSDLQQAEATMMAAMERLGRSFTGLPLSETYVAPDGNIEKVFQNCAMFVDPDDLSRVQFRPLPLILNIERQPPVGPSGAEGMYFYPVLGNELGYNIYSLYLEYITLHGTMEVFGPPIEELRAGESGISVQCFTNFCLEYHAKAPKALRIRPAALGLRYLYERAPTPTPEMVMVQPEPMATAVPEVVVAYTPEPVIIESELEAAPGAVSEPEIVAAPTEVAPAEPVQADIAPTVTPLPTEVPQQAQVQAIPQATPPPRKVTGPLNLQVWERYAMLSLSDVQEIGVSLFEGSQPLSDVGFTVIVSLPDGQQKVYVMPLTGTNGASMVTLEPIIAPQGAVIPYQVCITNLLDMPICIKESFIIWGG